MYHRTTLVLIDFSGQCLIAPRQSYNLARHAGSAITLLYIIDGLVKKITTTLIAVFMTLTFVFGQTSNKTGKKTNNDVIITIKNKSQDTLNAGTEYDMNIKLSLTYKHNFTVSVSGATIRGANGKYKIKTSGSSKTTVTITSSNGRKLLLKKDYVIIR